MLIGQVMFYKLLLVCLMVNNGQVDSHLNGYSMLKKGNLELTNSYLFD